jgi:hypothetical protein
MGCPVRVTVRDLAVAKVRVYPNPWSGNKLAVKFPRAIIHILCLTLIEFPK